MFPEQDLPALRAHFGLSDRKPSGCDATVLRVEGPVIDPTGITAAVEKSGFRCDVLPDSVCT